MLPSSYVTWIFPPVTSKFVPFTYVVFLGKLTILIPVTLFVTVTLNAVVFPSYVTVNSCSPKVFLLYPVTIFVVISFSSLLPSSYVTWIFPPANIVSVNSVPFTYVVLLGVFVTSIPITFFATTVTCCVVLTSIPSSSYFISTAVLPILKYSFKILYPVTNLVLPSLYVAVTSIPVLSNSVPSIYSVLSGAFVTSIDTIFFFSISTVLVS